MFINKGHIHFYLYVKLETSKFNEDPQSIYMTGLFFFLERSTSGLVGSVKLAYASVTTELTFVVDGVGVRDGGGGGGAGGGEGGEYFSLLYPSATSAHEESCQVMI